MPIVIARTGDMKLRVEDMITPEQRQRLWEQIVKNYVEQHKDTLRKAMED